MTLIREFKPQKDDERLYDIALMSLDEIYNPNVFLGFYALWPQGQLVAVDIFDRPIGYISSVRLRDGWARIMMLAVDEENRGKGVGSELLLRFRAESARSGISAMTLEVKKDNEKAIRFYEKNGFRRTRVLSRFYADGSDGMRMDSPVHLYI
ncbi:MAG: N-acetyltransferase [Candidatus Methanomethylophilaceae archaeon]|nr:N-acetyltransferase [Candidatus Methanomethylophilaceae archaeon]